MKAFAFSKAGHEQASTVATWEDDKGPLTGDALLAGTLGLSDGKHLQVPRTKPDVEKSLQHLGHGRRD